MALAKQNGNATPGRRGHKGTDNQYFEVGKVGRKTGITLRDTGVRDEHGLEPVSGIFSSSPAVSIGNGHDILASEDMDMDESSAPDVTAALDLLRKTPRLPPARQSTPKHTNIGSPKRMSSARPTTRGQSVVSDEDSEPGEDASDARANRVLDFSGAANRTRKSIHGADDIFKPKKALRRSNGPLRPDPFELRKSPAAAPGSARSTNLRRNEPMDLDEDVEQSIEQIGDVVDDYDAPPILDDDFHESYELQPEFVEDQNTTESAAQTYDNDIRSQKRSRVSLQSQSRLSAVQTANTEGDTSEPAPKRRRGRPSDKSRNESPTEEPLQDIDPALIADIESTPLDAAPKPSASSKDARVEEAAEPSQETKRKRGRPGKAARVPKAKAPSSSAPVARTTSPTKQAARAGSVGPMSNVNLRASTPFEDAGQQSSRFGRNLIKPLKYWANESRIYKQGNIEGIVRADPVENVRPRTAAKRRKGKKPVSNLEDISEHSDTESVLPDEWEDEQGVMTYTVANWNATAGVGDPDDPIEEDIVFAKSALITRDVAGSNFKYAKITTIDFFGAGLVELPPSGFKRAKNSRKMHMVFFVHEGKVVVDVGGGPGLEANSFTISKGGVWIVPRGNNYAINNPSTTRTAHIFFAQGCQEDAVPNE